MVDPDQLIGPQVIDMIMNKPGMIRWFKLCYFLYYFSIEFSFLVRYYSLLYQSLIPNCKLTINTLRQHISISDNIEQYILGAASHRTSCQRLINFLLTRLYSEKDYMQFCYHLNIISVMTNLPYRLITGINTEIYNYLYTTCCHFYIIVIYHTYQEDNNRAHDNNKRQHKAHVYLTNNHAQNIFIVSHNFANCVDNNY